MAIAWSVIIEHILSRLWSWWSVDHRTKHGPFHIDSLANPFGFGVVVVSQSILKLIWTFSSLTFSKMHFIHPPKWSWWSEIVDWVGWSFIFGDTECSDWCCASLSWDWTGRSAPPGIAWYSSVAKGTPWYFLVPPGTLRHSQGTDHLYQLARLGSVPPGPDTRRTTLVQDARSCLPSWTACQEGTLLLHSMRTKTPWVFYSSNFC